MENRGGARPGAGRKKGEDRVTYTIKISPTTRDIIIHAKERGVAIGKLLDELITDWWNRNFV